MTERPIIFSAPMVRAILAGRKTMTRRLAWKRVSRGPNPEGAICYTQWNRVAPGDQLWVRETWGAVWPDERGDVYDESIPGDGLRPLRLDECRIEYRADLRPGDTDYPGQWPADEARGNPEAPKWRSPIHMPRWASRITLEVTDVRRQRLRDMDGPDAVAEGAAAMCCGAPYNCDFDCLDRFRQLWDSLHKRPGERWNDDPEVVALTFRRITPP